MPKSITIINVSWLNYTILRRVNGLWVGDHYLGKSCENKKFELSIHACWVKLINRQINILGLNCENESSRKNERFIIFFLTENSWNLTADLVVMADPKHKIKCFFGGTMKNWR